MAETMSDTTPVVTSATPSLTVTPGAKAVVDEAAETVTAQVTATERFDGTSATLHTEDQCTLSDLSVSRFKPPVGATTTFLFYNVQNLCDQSGNANGSLEIPDTAFTGDPRTSNTVKLVIDLAPLAGQVLGVPLNANITWVKTPESINRSRNRSVSETLIDGVKKVMQFETKFTSTTARMTGTSNLFTFNPETTANIFWDTSTNLVELP